MTDPHPSLAERKDRMIGRFIFHCDTEHFDVACSAAKYLLQHSECKDVVTSQPNSLPPVTMYARRLKKSISVQQVKP